MIRVFTLVLLLASAALLRSEAAAQEPPPPPPPAEPGTPSSTPVAPPNISPPDAWVPAKAGTLRVLNKIDSTVHSITLQVGQTVMLQTLSITLAACDIRPPDLPADSTAHLKIVDSRPDQPSLDGWILHNEPAANIYEHPVYDIQLAGCSN